MLYKPPFPILYCIRLPGETLQVKAIDFSRIPYSMLPFFFFLCSISSFVTLRLFHVWCWNSDNMLCMISKHMTTKCCEQSHFSHISPCFASVSVTAIPAKDECTMNDTCPPDMRCMGGYCLCYTAYCTYKVETYIMHVFKTHDDKMLRTDQFSHTNSSSWFVSVSVTAKLGKDECTMNDKCPPDMRCMGGYCRCRAGRMTTDKLFCMQEGDRLLGYKCRPSTDRCFQRTCKCLSGHLELKGWYLPLAWQIPPFKFKVRNYVYMHIG